jgi:hypothetical protein
MRRLIGCVALLGLACASLVQQPGCSEAGHYALLRALGDGTPEIDRYHWSTCDVAWYHGHFYAGKGPGLALVSFPFYELLRAAGLVWNQLPPSGYLSGIPDKASWPFTVLVVVLSACALFVLMKTLADRVVPGSGITVAIVLSLGTMLLPYSTMYQSHVPCAALGFAAFVALFFERRRPQSARLLFLGGFLAGLSLVFDLPNALVAVVLAGYAASRRPLLRRTVLYGVGAVLGALPLLAYDQWAFGSVAHQPYRDAVAIAGQTGHDVVGSNAGGFFGIGVPSLTAAARLLLLNHGLLVTTPIVAAGIVGLVLLARESAFRAEAVTISVLIAAFLTWNAGYYLPFGGDSAGPRFLIPLLPFLCLPLALVLRRAPAVFAALGAVSIAVMVVATLTGPMLETDDTGTWFTSAVHGAFQDSLVAYAGVSSRAVAVLPTVLLFCALAALAVAAARGVGVRGREVKAAVLALVAWALVGSTAPAVLSSRLPHPASALAALALLAGAIALVLVLGIRARGNAHGATVSTRGSALS